jgi:hypothetical protein
MMKFPCFFAVLEEFYFAFLVLERNERGNYLLQIIIRKRRAKENIKKGDSRTEKKQLVIWKIQAVFEIGVPGVITTRQGF